MARFDVYKYASKTAPLVVDVQADLLSDLHTRVVIPLAPEKKARKEALPRLKPMVRVHREDYILITTDIGTLTKSSLGKPVANIEDAHRQDITDALDFLFQGF